MDIGFIFQEKIYFKKKNLKMTLSLYPLSIIWVSFYISRKNQERKSKNDIILEILHQYHGNIGNLFLSHYLCKFFIKFYNINFLK